MSLSEEERRQSQTTTSLYLSLIKLENFGRFRNESFEFHRGMNVIDGGHGAGKTTILKAIEILLWATQSESVSDMRALAENYMVASESGFFPLAIKGYFEEFDHDLALTGIQHSLSVLIHKAKGKLSLKYLWGEDPKSISQVRGIFAEYGLHQTSVFCLSEDKIASRKLVPMDFFHAKLDEIPWVKAINKNVEILEAKRPNLLDELELYSLTSIVCETAKKKISNLLGPDSANVELLMRQEELEKLNKYSEYRKLTIEARRLERIIQKHGKRLEREEKRVRMREARRVKQLRESACDPALVDKPGGSSTCLTPREILDQLRQELSQRRAEVAEMNERSAISNTSEKEQRSLAQAIEQEKRVFIELSRKLIRLELRKCLNETRLKLLPGGAETEGDTRWYQRTLKQRIEFLEKERAMMEDSERKLGEALSEQQGRLQETMILKNTAEAQMDDKRKNLFILHDSKMLNSFALAELEELMASGTAFESLEYEVMTSLSVNFVQLLQEVPLILEDFGIGGEPEWLTFGYFGTIIELIDVESEYRALMYPLKDFLATHLVRDIALAWRLRDAIQKLEFLGQVRVIALNDYEAENDVCREPPGTERLSRFIELKPGCRVASDEGLCSRIRSVIANELRGYFFIQGDPTVARETARRLLADPEWESCQFVTRDGRCFSLDEESGPPPGQNPIGAYESLSEYWNSLRSKISDREQDLQRLKEAEEKCKVEHSQLRDATLFNSGRIGNIQVEINSLLLSKRSQASRISEIESHIKQLQEELAELERGQQRRDALSEHLNILDADVENIGQEIHRLDESIAESTASMARLVIDETKNDIDHRRLNDQQCHVSILESEVDHVEDFLEKISDGDIEALGDEERDEPLREQSRAEDFEPEEPEITNLRTTIFLLRRKLELIQRRITQAGITETPQNWIRGRDYADELKKLRERSKTAVGLSFDGTLRRKLEHLAEEATQTYTVSNVAMTALMRFLDVSQEKALLPDLGRDALVSLVERFKENFLELAPRGDVRMVRPEKATARRGDAEPSERRGKKRKADKISAEGYGDAVIEVSFNTAVSRLRIPRQLSGGEESILNLSVLLSPTALNPPRILLLDEVDAPFDQSTQSHFAGFINKFRRACQLFVISHKAPHGSLEADRRISVASHL